MHVLLFRRSFSVFLLFFLCAGWAVTTRSATFSVNPTADAFVTTGPSGNLSANNYGGAGALSVAAPGLSQGEFQSVLMFSLSGAKSAFDGQFGVGQWSIQSVVLQFTAALPNNAIFNPVAAGQFSVSWMQNDSWVEGTGTPGAPTATGITFSSLPGFLSGADEALGTFSFNGATNGAASYTLSLASSFSAEVVSGSNVSLRLAAADSAISYFVDSRSFGTASARPSLTISAVPEPGTLGLIVSGLACLIWNRKGQQV